MTKKPRITADKLSEKSGFDVYARDLFNADPVPTSLQEGIPEAPNETRSISAKVSYKYQVSHNEHFFL